MQDKVRGNQIYEENSKINKKKHETNEGILSEPKINPVVNKIQN